MKKNKKLLWEQVENASSRSFTEQCTRSHSRSAQKGILVVYAGCWWRFIKSECEAHK